MNAKSEVERASGADVAKMVLAFAVLAGGIAGFYYLEAQPLWIRLLGLLAIIGIAVFVMLQTAAGRSTWGFLSEARTEVRKVVWPTRHETLQTSLIIFVAVALTAFFLWVVDSILFWAVRELTGRGG